MRHVVIVGDARIARDENRALTPIRIRIADTEIALTDEQAAAIGALARKETDHGEQ